MLEIWLGAGTAGQASPNGQVEYVTPGTYQWVCPEKVHSVSLVIIAGGEPGKGSGAWATGGAGGGLWFHNDVAVEPGQTYTIVVGNGNGAPTSSALGTSVGLGATKSGSVSGGSAGGTGGNAAGGNPSLAEGGMPGRYDGRTGSRNTGQQMVGAGTRGEATGRYGSGGWSVAYKSGTPTNAPGQGGAVRLIWGPNRQYPSTNVADK